jgi:tetratricopeptide (TPR) repeat protein/transglutaminase-like putative cysteine protease
VIWSRARFRVPAGVFSRSLATTRLSPVAFAAAAVLLSTVAVTDARADVSDRLPRLAKLRADIAASSGPLAYVAVRKLWGEWDRGDPNEVEEALHEVARDTGEPAPVRAYASLLEAYARRRRGDLDGARARIARLGYVGKWLVVGPFENDGKVGPEEVYEPEKDQDGAINLTHDYDGKDHKPVRWRMLPAVSPYGWVDFGAFLRPAEQSCVYATTFVRDARKDRTAPRTISVWAGATGALRLYWNGTPILRDDKYRDLDSDRFAATATLRQGYNRLTAKVCGDDRAPMLSLRVAAADGAPDEQLEVDADPSHSTAAGGAVLASAGKGPAVPPPARVEGPAQAFERLVQGGDPAMLEAYARYLGTTGSDDPTEHRARELARRAAEKQPTIERMLLAGELAESRNQRTSWVDQAEALVAKVGATQVTLEERIDVLLARATLAHAGVNWRDAVPFYEQVLALDPDNVPATLAKADAYDDVGLRETALTLLEGALARRPRSVALLRAAAASLRDQGRETEADELAERYTQLRFDDPSFVRAHIDLAVARRDTASAARWIDRLVATDPDGAGALRAAAQAWMRLGDRRRAIAVYRSAVDLAPGDTDLLHELAAAYALAGEDDERLRLLKRVLELMPQAKEVRDEVAHMEPPRPRADEQYARPASEFLAARALPAAGQARRSLVDLQVTTVFPNGLASRFHQVVYQPLTDAAAAESREYDDIEFESDSQTVQVRAARVYRKDGTVDEAVESGAGAMAEDPAMAVYTSARAYYVRFPRLEPGDVVELQYRVEDVAPRNEFADYFGEVTYMQARAEPTVYGEYVLVTPKSRAFYFNEPRVPGMRQTIEDRGDQRVYRFVARDVPAVDQEALQPPWTEVLGHVHVSTYKSWDEMGRWYWGLVKDQFVPDDEVRRRAEALTVGRKDEAAKVRAIYDYVVQETRYVALEFGIHGYKPYRCAQIFARGFGDCKDKATLIVTMLGALGIKATPVIVRTANKGDIEPSPASLAPFDHMIAYVPSLDLYLDGTAEYTGSLELPAMDRGAMALQVNEGAARLVHLPDPPASASVSSHKLDASLTADGGAAFDWRVDVSGAEASEWRVRFHAASTRRRRVQEVIAAFLPGSEVASVEAGSLEDIEQNVAMRVRGKISQFARAEGDGWSVPLGRKEHMVRDYASLATRRLDVRLPAQWTEQDDWIVRLPPGAKARSVPAPSRGSGPFGSYALEVESTGNALHVTTTITLTKTRIAAAEYPAFRAWCEQVDHALGQRATVTLR